MLFATEAKLSAVGLIGPESSSVATEVARDSERGREFPKRPLKDIVGLGLLGRVEDVEEVWD